MEELIRELFKDETEFSINKYIKTSMIIEAIFPMNNHVRPDGERETFEDTINYYITRENYPWPKDSMEIIKGYMKKYFPWRIDGDKIKFIDDVDVKKREEE